MIALNDVYSRCIAAARLGVGSYLHQTTKTGVGAVGAVYKSKSKRPTGKYPLIIVDVATRRAQGAATTFKYYDTSGDKVTEIIYDYFITYAVYGDKALEIAGELDASFVREDIQLIFNTDDFANVAETFPITSTTTIVDNEYKDFASFIVKITAVDRVIESVDEVLTVNADLNLRQPDSDDNLVSAPITITAP